MNKKAQLQMTENIAIIVVIVFILMFGFIFYAKVRAESLKGKIREYSDLDLVKASQVISSLPEISCSINSVEQVGCLDQLKLEAFINLNLTKDYYEYYRSMFGKSRINIVSVFPENDSNYKIYDNNYTESYNENSIFIPMNIFNPIDNTLNIGYIQVTKYTRIMG